MTTDFQQALQQRLREHDIGQVLRQLGYAPDNRQAMARLLQAVESPCHGLDQSHYDFRYSSPEFLRALCRVLDLAPEPVEAEITRIQAALQHAREAWRPFIWVDTHFRRQSQPLFALAACESQRYLRFDWPLAQQPLAQQLPVVRGRISEHWQTTGGQLGIWGAIQEYWYFYQHERACRLNPAGAVIGFHTGPVPSQAGVTVKGRQVPCAT